MIVCLVLASTARAEIYAGIRPFLSYATVRGLFSGATIEELHPVWLGEREWLYSISGTGMSGTIVVKFSRFDAATYINGQIERYQGVVDSLVALDLRTDDELVSDYKEVIEIFRKQYAIEPTIAQDSAKVEWVRWVPSSPVPIRNLVNKYGASWVKGYSDEDMEPYYEWKGRGVTAYLDDNTKEVSKVDFSFTVAEMMAALSASHPSSGGRNNNRNRRRTTTTPPPKPKARTSPKL